MSHDTFLIVCGILIAIPFIVSCIKGNPMVGLVAGTISFFVMALAATHDASMFQIHLMGFIIAGIGVSRSLHD